MTNTCLLCVFFFFWDLIIRLNFVQSWLFRVIRTRIFKTENVIYWNIIFVSAFVTNWKWYHYADQNIVPKYHANFYLFILLNTIKLQHTTFPLWWTFFIIKSRYQLVIGVKKGESQIFCLTIILSVELTTTKNYC